MSAPRPGPYRKNFLRKRPTSALREMKRELLVYRNQPHNSGTLVAYYQDHIDAITAELRRRDHNPTKEGKG